MYKAYKVRIYPTIAQRQLIEKSFGCSRFVYNFFLKRSVELYNGTQQKFSRFEANKCLTALKKEHEWLCEADSQALTQEIRHLESAYGRFFKKIGNFPRFKKKNHSRNSYGSNKVNGIDFDKHKVNLQKLKRVKFRDNRSFEGSIVEYTISLDSTGKYWCSLLVEDGKAALRSCLTTLSQHLELILELRTFLSPPPALNTQNLNLTRRGRRV